MEEMSEQLFTLENVEFEEDEGLVDTELDDDYESDDRDLVSGFDDDE